MFGATLTSDVEVRGASDLMLKHLEISGCKGEKSIKVSAPNLTYISFSGNSVKLLFENVPRLEYANFYTADPDFLQQFAHISELQSLHIGLYYPMGPSWKDVFPQMPNLKWLHIDWYNGCNYSLLQITDLIWASPRLEKFSIKEVSIRRRGWYPGHSITAAMEAAEDDLQQKLRGKVVANYIRLQCLGCDVIML